MNGCYHWSSVRNLSLPGLKSCRACEKVFCSFRLDGGFPGVLQFILSLKTD